MLRATVWTVGLFGAGTALCRTFPSTWTEPVVLLALGLALLFVSARTARATRAARTVPANVATMPAPAPRPAPASAPLGAPIAAAAPVQVERTA
jgi:hypothetical protein